MTHAYKITGMTCSSCKSQVEKALSAVPFVKAVSVSLESALATVEMEKHVETKALQEALSSYPKFTLSEENSGAELSPSDQVSETFFQKYKPILLVFGFITGITLLLEMNQQSFEILRWMDHFMAGFFIVFSFFKLLDLKGFAESYFSYDIISRSWFGWGYIYPFIELFLGLSYLLGLNPLLTNFLTIVVMGLSIIGVIKSLLMKRKIRCACLGAVFNLPMSSVTLFEDALMLFMSTYMLTQML